MNIIADKTEFYGGWVAVKGLPFHLWTQDVLKQIGDLCGGWVETDKNTMNFTDLREARIWVRRTEAASIPTQVEVRDRGQIYGVRVVAKSLTLTEEWRAKFGRKQAGDTESSYSYFCGEEDDSRAERTRGEAATSGCTEKGITNGEYVWSAKLKSAVNLIQDRDKSEEIIGLDNESSWAGPEPLEKEASEPRCNCAEM